eukprot:TRINITY_DN2728_c0_g2_i1.p1 TRINITY_DN2728_c0_g2~~TRINITY_DN2728_c0_g2_i1.p1  ORF type:complete len:565 (+),score=185.88 TRINITY_DN2728_c0_g2_i1:82-1776(+)
MGLGLKARLFEVAGRRVGTLATLLGVASVGMLLLLPVTGSRGTYFSENSLMIGMSSSPLDGAAVGWVEARAAAYEGAAGGEGNATAAVLKDFDAAGLQPWVQAWEGGRNLVARVRSQRGSGGTGVVITAHHRDPYSLALTAKLAEVYADVGYLGLDVHIVVVVGDYKAGLSAFAAALLDDPERSPKVNVRGLRAAFVLDFAATGFDFEYVHLMTLSDDGRQPNMDLVNSAQKLCRFRTLRCATILPDTPAAPAWFADAAEAYLRPLPNAHRAPQLGQSVVNYFRYMLEGFWGSGAGAPHSGLREAGIHALTLRGVGRAPRGARAHTEEVGYLVSGLVRGMNNLNERLHQSFWTYYYTDNELFVDYETLQPLPWLAAASIIASSFRPAERAAQHAASGPAIALLVALTGALAAGKCPAAAAAAGAAAAGYAATKLAASPDRTALLLQVKFTLALYIASLGVLSTVLHCPLAVFGTVHAALLSLCAVPSRSAAARAPAVLGAAALVYLLVAFWATVPPTAVPLLRAYYYSAALPFAALSLAVALCGRAPHARSPAARASVSPVSRG